MDNQEPGFQDLTAIISDKQTEMATTLERERYKIKVPRAEFAISRSSLIITREDSTEEISEGQLVEILDGKDKEVSEQDKKVIDEWYQISRYKYGYELDKLDRAAKKAEESGDKEELQKIKAKIKEIGDSYHSKTPQEFDKAKLAYYYNEQGPRLERLYEILYGECSYNSFVFGKIELIVTKNSQAQKPRMYEDSKGFFKDLSNAFNFIKSLKGPLEYSETTGISYTGEYARATGEEELEINGKKLSIRAEIEKDGMRNRFACIINSEVPIRELTETDLEVLLPEYSQTDLEEGLTLLTNDKLRILLGKTRIAFVGNPEDLSYEVPRVLETIVA